MKNSSPIAERHGVADPGCLNTKTQMAIGLMDLRMSAFINLSKIDRRFMEGWKRALAFGAVRSALQKFPNEEDKS